LPQSQAQVFDDIGGDVAGVWLGLGFGWETPLGETGVLLPGSIGVFDGSEFIVEGCVGEVGVIDGLGFGCWSLIAGLFTVCGLAPPGLVDCDSQPARTTRPHNAQSGKKRMASSF
jgi:hypothetical protein